VNGQRLLERALRIGCVCAALQSIWAADYVGARSCAPCHGAEYQKQSKSHHAQSLHTIADSVVGSILLRDGKSPDGKLRYQPDTTGILVHEEGLPERALLEWAFGAGVQGSTPVGHLGGQFFEHQFSFYSRIHALGPTFGHPAHPGTPIAEIGILQDDRTIFKCFNCHATGVKQGENGPDLDNLLPGVQCERCHGPGSAHIKAAEQHAPVAAIRNEVVNPGRLQPRAQIEICGECHRLPTPDTGDRPEVADPVNIRFAPIGLLASRCFRESKTLSCLTCHDPHDNARPRTDASYSEKCLGCHENDREPIKLCRRMQKQDCLPCHMRQASLGTYLQFTDHRIHVY